MSEVSGVVVAHGDLARALVDAAQRIAGVEGALQAVSNQGCNPEELRKRVAAAMADMPAIVFVDLASGSCGHAGRVVIRGMPERALLTGVNLPMLLDFLFHRGMEIHELAARLAEIGRAGAVAHVSDGSEPDLAAET